MSDNEPERPEPRFNLWERVKIRNYRGARGRIVELRGPLAPGGVQVYRVVVRRKVPGTKPIDTDIELREDQLERVPARA